MELSDYAKDAEVPEEIVKDAFIEAREVLGSGYTPDYYWSSIAEPLCRYYKYGYESGINSKSKRKTKK